MKDIKRNVTLLCPICGNDQFDSLDGEFDSPKDTPDDARYRCSDCGNIITKEDLIAENTEKISNAVEELTKDAAKEFEKELGKMLKKVKF